MAVNIKYYSDRAKKTFVKLAEKIKDLTPIWSKFTDYYQNEIIPAAWSTKGAIMEGERWKPLTEKYRKWKQKKYPGKPLLVLTNKLFSAAQGGSGWYQKLKKRSMEMGVQGSLYFYYVSERKKNPRKYFYTSDGSLPNRAWAWLIKETSVYLEEADDGK
jgi:hypothetical protein